MSAYVMKIGFDDRADASLVDLPGMSLSEAEEFVAQVRFDVAEAKTLDAPVVEEIQAGRVGIDGAAIDIVLDPRRVISIDLQEAAGRTGQDLHRSADGPVELT